MNMNWKWPQKPGNNLQPWFIIGWRALFVLPILAGLCITWFLIALGFGPAEAQRFWDDAT